MKLSDIGEFGLIDLLQRELPDYPASVVRGIGDDAAVLRVDGGKLLLMSSDMLIGNSHFSLAFASPWQVGVKALNVNISDIAAMGGQATHATISIGVPPETDPAVVQGIYRGIGDMARQYKVSVVGGDTVASPLMVINITVIGEVEESKVLYRSGAKPGDIIFVTGALGGSAAGLHFHLNPGVVCPEDVARQISKIHLEPVPRVAESSVLAGSGMVTAMNDVSDGLASELHEICSASAVGCRIYKDKIPVDRGAEIFATGIGQDALDWALYGGEDYQLVFTVPQHQAPSLTELMQAKGMPVVVIGEITEQDMYLVDEQGQANKFAPGGYNHFTE